MRGRLLLLGTLALALALALIGADGGSTDLATDSAVLGDDGVDNDWLKRRVLNMAHQGGQFVAPSNTLYAYHTAIEHGADVLELDVHATKDGELVLLHDTTVQRTTDGPKPGQPASGRVDEMTLEQIKQLDAAYWFVPDRSACHDCDANGDGKEYVFRGFATGARPIPEELRDFEPNDFTVPTLREVLEQFPKTPLNIEIKRTAPDTQPYEAKLAALLQEFDRDDRDGDVIVVSFFDAAIKLFKAAAPEVDTAPGMGETTAFVMSSQGEQPGVPYPHHVALQVPIDFQINLEGQPITIRVVTEDFVADAHANGLAVHVWTINDRATMEWLIDIGVDGIMTDDPPLLEEVIGEKDVEYLWPAQASR